VPENREILQKSTPEAIYVDVSDDEAIELALEDTDAVVLGPGLGTNGLSVDLANKVTKGPGRPLVLDADALNLAAEGFFDLRALGKSRPMLSTPHAGEMSRLLGESKSNIIGDRLAALREAVERFEHCFLLKGTPSLISNTGRGILVGSQGTSDLAVGGMGDTLTGVCGALIAQGLGVMEAGAVSLYLTGRAANLAARGASLTPSDVIRWMPDALIERGAGTSELGFPFVFYDADAAR
jgi:NAD(P)H-hydrate epimerase